MRPIRALILTYIYTDNDTRYGGEGRVVWETTHALARAGVDVHVITSMKNFTATLPPNITLYQVPFAKKDFLNFNPGELLKMFLWSIPLLFLKGIDVIHHLPTNGPDPFARFKFGRIFAMSADPDWGYDTAKFSKDLELDRARKLQEYGFGEKAHYSFDLSSKIARRFFRWTGIDELFPKGVDIFFCRTRGVYDKLTVSHPQSLLSYVPNGVDIARFSPDTPPLYPKKQGGLRFLYVGSISRRKGVHHLVQAFVQVAALHPEHELYIGGSGDSKFIEELQALAAPYPQIKFCGKIPDEDLPGFYASGDVFCLLPLAGPMLTVLAETMASGLPVIATSGNGCGEVVAERNTGFLVEPGDIDSLVQTMEKVIQRPDERKEKAANALAASRFFSWDHIAATIAEGYKSALERKNS